MMNALSRREEDALLKTAKSRALKECDQVVKGSNPPEVVTILTTLKRHEQISQNVLRVALFPSFGPAKRNTKKYKIAC